MVRNLPYTVETNVQNSKEIFELRICLETWFLLRDIHKYQEEDLRKIDAALYSLEKVLLESRSKKTIIQAHTAFHCSLFEITGNKQLINLVNLFSSMAMNITVLHKASISDRKHFVAYHRNIVAAIRARDPDQLERSVREHFSEGIGWIESLSE